MSCVIGEVYPWSSSDTIVANGSTDAGGNYDLDNVKDASLFKEGRITTAGDNQGLEFRLAANISCFAIAILNLRHVSGEENRFGFTTDTTWTGANKTAEAAASPTVAGDVWTGASALGEILEAAPVNQDFLIGYDTLSTMPTSPAPGSVETVTVRSGIVVSKTSTKAGRTFWSWGYVALGINPTSIQTVPVEGLTIERPKMNDGTGYRWRATWPTMPRWEFQALQSLWVRSDRGNFPAFVFFVPSGKNSSGEFTDPDDGPDTRGGCVRLESISGSTRGPAGTYDVANVELVCTSWQESPLP